MILVALLSIIAIGSGPIATIIQDLLSLLIYFWTVRALLRFPGGVVGRLCARLLFEKAQRAAERLHGRMRRELLTLDDQISDSLAFSGRPE